MAPVSPAVIKSVAEAFSSFESDRKRLASFKAALAAAERFLTGYRLYAQVAAKRRADRVLAAHYEYEAGTKEFLNAEADCDRSLAELARLKAEMQRLADEEHAIEAELAVFQQNSRTKDARALDRSSLGNFGLEQARREANERRRDAE